MIFKPMLAGKVEEVKSLSFPVLVSPKLDGIRCLIKDGQAVSRKLKPIPNKFISKKLSGLPDGLDGELMVLTGDFNSVQSAVMSFEGEPDFYYFVFDNFMDVAGFQDRFKNLEQNSKYVRIVPHTIVNNPKELTEQYDEYMRQGYEGLMVRSIEGPYKCGRSTTREGYLLKLKKFHDSEATVIGFTERMHNANKKKINALGRSERSSAKAGKVPMATLGALKVEWNGIEFDIGTGFDDNTRKEIWMDQENYLGTLVKFKYQELSAKGVPRFPVFLGFRHGDDT